MDEVVDRVAAHMNENMEMWCVQHRDGWCAVRGGKRPTQDAASVETKCGHHVVLPFGVEWRKPDCIECVLCASPA